MKYGKFIREVKGQANEVREPSIVGRNRENRQVKNEYENRMRIAIDNIRRDLGLPPLLRSLEQLEKES